jgi:hypothetical protein
LDALTQHQPHKSTENNEPTDTRQRGRKAP